MPDYYIRTPDHEESRGPFNSSKLLTLAEAGQIDKNTLYYDEDKEEWVPIAVNETLKQEVFPEREKLSLQMQGKDAKKKGGAEKPAPPKKGKAEKKDAGLKVEEMLAAAEGDTKQTRHLKKQKASFEKAANLAAPALGLMMLLSAVALIFPHFEIATEAINTEAYTSLFNHPLIIVAFFDFAMAVALFLAVTEVYPIIRGRSMLTLGFGAYVGWALGDPILMGCSIAAGFGIFYATVSRSYTSMLAAIAIGVGGNGYLAYLAITGRFSNFFDAAMIDFITP